MSESPHPPLRVLSRDQIRGLLEQFTYRLGETGESLNCVVVGGAALALSVIPDRAATRDIDVFAQLTPQAEAIIEAMAKEHNLAKNWLNSEAQQFMSPVSPNNESDLDVVFEHQGVAVRVLDERSLFAMKCRAGRLSKDGPDLIALAELLEIASIDEAQQILDDYYGGEEAMKPTARNILNTYFAARLDLG